MPSPRQLMQSALRSLLKFTRYETVPQDDLILALRRVYQARAISPLHFQEVVETIFRLARSDVRCETLLGSAQIQAGQNAIIRNLATTVIGSRRFLVLDVGAHDGWFIDRLLDETPDVKVVAFEPMPQMLPELERRKARWPDLEIVPKAVGDEPGVLPLRVYPGLLGVSSLLDFEEGYRYFEGQFDPADVKTVDVPIVTVDDYFAANPACQSFDYVAIKIDVQGFEDRVLRGAAGLLASGRVRAILIEITLCPKYSGAWDYLRIVNHLEGLGFRLYDANPFYRQIGMTFQPTAIGRLTEMDCLFVHSSALHTTTNRAA